MLFENGIYSALLEIKAFGFRRSCTITDWSEGVAMISTTVKKSLNKLKFYREIELPDFASKGSIPIRHLNIGFDGKEIDVEFYMNNQFATLFFAWWSRLLVTTVNLFKTQC